MPRGRDGRLRVQADPGRRSWRRHCVTLGRAVTKRSTHTPVESIIDLDTYRELEATAGAEFAAELVATFLEEAPSMLADLRTAHAASDADTFRRVAHSIKSNGATFGAVALADLARELELGALPTGTAPLDRLEAACAQATSALRTLADG